MEAEVAPSTILIVERTEVHGNNSPQRARSLDSPDTPNDSENASP